MFASSVIPLKRLSALLVMGAVYFINNEPTGNFVISADIDADGKLANVRQRRVSWGMGAHSLPDDTVGDPLLTQGAIRASRAGGILATVNAGSNTAVVFAIDAQTPSNITMIGSPVPSGGQFPVSVAINKPGNRVCVLNGGAVNGVMCFSVDRKHGLIPLVDTLRRLNINQTTPATGPNGTVGDIIFSEDDTKLIVSVKGVPPTPGFLAMWDVATDGSLSSTFTKSTPAAGSLLPFGMAVIPGGRNAILVADVDIGFDVFTFNGDGATSTVVPIPGEVATCWLSFSPKVGNFFISDPGLSILTEVHVDDDLNGSIVKQHQQASGSGTLDSDVATIGNQDFLYVLSPGSLTIEALVPVAPGNLMNLQSFDFSAGAKQAGVTVQLRNVQGMAAYAKWTWAVFGA